MNLDVATTVRVCPMRQARDYFVQADNSVRARLVKFALETGRQRSLPLATRAQTQSVLRAEREWIVSRQRD